MILEPRPNLLEDLDVRPEEAMRELVECYTPMICRIAGRYLQTAEDIKDVVNDTFAEVYICRASYDPVRSGLSTWIGTIARNTAVSMYRRNRDLLFYKEMVSPGIAEPDFAERVQNIIDLEEAIERLGERDQQLIRMKYYGNMTLAEIATFLGLPY